MMRTAPGTALYICFNAEDLRKRLIIGSTITFTHNFQEIDNDLSTGTLLVQRNPNADRRQQVIKLFLPRVYNDQLKKIIKDNLNISLIPCWGKDDRYLLEKR